MRVPILLFIALYLSTPSVNSQPYYSFVNLFNKDKKAKKDEIHAYLNSSGKITYLEKDDEIIKPLSEGLGIIEKGRKFGYIDSDGYIKIPIIYDDAESFSDGLAAVKLNGKWGYINKKNDLIIKHTLISNKPFINKIAYYKDESVMQNNLYKYIDTTGNFINSEYYLLGNNFSDDCAWVKDRNTKNWGCINKKGEYIIEPKYQRVTAFKNGRAWVQISDKWGYINKKGEYIIEPTFGDTNNELNGYTWVEKYNVWGLVDSTGKMLIPFTSKNEVLYGLKTAFSYIKLSTPSNGLLVFNAGYKSGYYDLNFKEVIPPMFDEATNFVDGIAMVKLNNKWGLIDTTGKLVCGFKYKFIKYLDHGLFYSEEINNSIIVFDKTGKPITDETFIKVKKFE